MNACVLEDLADPEFDPALADDITWGTVENPWPEIARFRTESPIAEGEYRVLFKGHPDPTLAHLKHYSAFGYDEVERILMDPILFSSERAHELSTGKAFGRMLVVMDPPDHTRYRKILQAAFSPKLVKQWTETLIRPNIHALLDQIVDRGSAELVESFTYRYPFEAVFRLLDLPPEDVQLFQKLAVIQSLVQGFPAEATEAGRKLGDYFRTILADRRERPGDDLISQLVLAEVGGESVEDEVLIPFLRHILNAAADTSYRTTGSLLVALLREPGLLDAVRRDRSLVPIAIEEALRWEGPILANFRMVTRDVEMAGVSMPAGSIVHVVQGSANRDETRFPYPDRFDLGRSRKHRHFGFGTGPHLCIGMHLARLQIGEAINALLDRLPNLRLDPAEPPPVIRGFSFRAPRRLDVVFDPA